MIDNLKDYFRELIKLFKKGIGGKSDLIKIDVTTTNTAYSIGDCVGGVLTLTGVDACNKTAIIQNLIVKDAKNQSGEFNLLIYDKHPVDVGGATCTDNAAFAVGNSLPYLIGVIPVASSDYITADSKNIATINNLGRVVKMIEPENLYLVLVAVNTPDYTATTTDLTLIVTLLKD